MKKKQWAVLLLTIITIITMVPSIASAREPELVISFCCPGVERCLVDRFWDVPEGATFDFTSADPSVVKVDSEGNMMGITAGASTTITMTIKDKDGNVIDTQTASVTVGHPASFVESMKEPTCTEPGEIDRWFCPYCGKIFKDEACTIEISEEEIMTNPPRHGETELKNVKKATETKEGYTGDKVCKDCGAVVEKGEVIAKLEPKPVDPKPSNPKPSNPKPSEPEPSEPEPSEPEPSEPEPSEPEETESEETSSVIVDISKDTTVAGEVFEQARNEGKDLELQGEGYSWTFSKDALAEMSEFPSDFDTKVLLDDALAKEEREKLAQLTGDKVYYGFSFGYHGELPGKAEITLTVGNEFAGKTVTVYSVSDAGEAVAEADATVTADGQLTFETTHCSLWFISEADTPAGEKPTEDKPVVDVPEEADGNSWIWMIVMVVLVVAAVGGFCWWYFIYRKKSE